MSRFHDELVAARRRGEAPGQHPDAPTRAPVEFIDVPDDFPLTSCLRCGAIVGADRAAYHDAWHAQIGD
ncbi:hypothetical protein [Amycolatopsis sp. PS_44_ISF1]|uniref:hypothetical protein n=1 Tax=Amycolatopsis sp. PS_44_ISF1 TaxID=2974917 RepID=UPI0028DEB982|nr:hypothetical protein [Amycolatopsis sp. PS_44_ISF1]MDT8915818.1 hypothetical protein [Amycolatopsis sp. PS_44_ISF1]